MTIRDYNEKIEFTLDFYNHAIATFYQVLDDIEYYKFKYGEDITDDYDSSFVPKKGSIDYKKFRDGREKELLINLGRVGEYAIKYVLLLEQMNSFPNQTFEEFKTRALYTIGEKATRNVYLNSYHMDQALLDQIKTDKDSAGIQPLHNFDYLFKILKTLYPNDVVLLDSMLANSLFMYKYDSTGEKLNVTYDFNDNGKITTEEDIFNRFKQKINDTMTSSGDAFIRLRYVENNPDGKAYNLKDMAFIMRYYVLFIRLVHEFNYDDIRGNIDEAFSKLLCIIFKVNGMTHFGELDDLELRMNLMSDGPSQRELDRFAESKRLYAIKDIFFDDINLFRLAVQSTLTSDELLEIKSSDIDYEIKEQLIRENINLEDYLNQRK